MSGAGPGSYAGHTPCIHRFTWQIDADIHVM